MGEQEDRHHELRVLALTALGFGVMKFQRFQVSRRQLEKWLSQAAAEPRR